MTRRSFAVAAGLLFAARPALARPDSFAPVVRRVLPSVVSIGVTELVGAQDQLADLPPEIRRQFRNRAQRNRQAVQGTGSGFIIDASGYIVTNNHVVGSADRITVSLIDGTELPARLIGTDELTDIALIKVEPQRPLVAAAWGDSDAMEVGDWVIAAGNPFGLGGSVTAGIISARGRDIGASPFDELLQFDAAINPGNSGGPLFNVDGQVIGVNTAIVSPNGNGSVGIGFAVPANVAARIAGELRAKGRVDRGWLGVSVVDLTGQDSQRRPQHGVGIAAIDRNGPAARAGIKAGDVVLAVNGQVVETSREVIRNVAAVAPGGGITVTVRRQGREMEIPVTVGRRPVSDPG